MRRGGTRVEISRGDRPLAWVALPPVLLLLIFYYRGVAGLRTKDATRVPSVSSDIKEMMPSEITQ